MSVVPKLNLNKHPKDCDNLSLVDARNIKISHDESCITNENSIITNALIYDFIFHPPSIIILTLFTFFIVIFLLWITYYRCSILSQPFLSLQKTKANN